MNFFLSAIVRRELVTHCDVGDNESFACYTPVSDRFWLSLSTRNGIGIEITIVIIIRRTFLFLHVFFCLFCRIIAACISHVIRRLLFTMYNMHPRGAVMSILTITQF